jgi:hypothetical protein
MARIDEIIADRNSAYHKSKALKRPTAFLDVSLRKEQRFQRSMQFRRSEPAWVNLDSLYPPVYTVSDLPTIQQAVQQNTADSLLFAAQAIRKMLSLDRAPMHELNESGLLQLVPRWVLSANHPQLQYESMIIANSVAACSVKYTQVLVSEGLLQGLVIALSSTNDDIKDEALVALARTSTQCPMAVDTLADLGLIAALLRVANTVRRMTVRHVCWVLASVARGRCLEQILHAGVALLLRELSTAEEAETLVDCCYILGQLSSPGIARVQVLIDIQAVPRLAALADSEIYGVQLAALRALGNISTGNDQQADVLMQPAVLGTIIAKICSTRKQIRKEAVWILSNLCAGPLEHIHEILAQGVLPLVMKLIAPDDLEVSREACWLVTNVVLNGTPEHVQVLLDTPVVFNLCQLLEEAETQLLVAVLTALKALLQDARARFQTDSGINPVKELIEASGGVSYLEDLQTHMDTEVYQSACFIIDQFFSTPAALLPDEDFLI